LSDHCDILETVAFVHEQRMQNRNVLIHCDGGMTRSPSVMIAYLMRYGTGTATTTTVTTTPTTTSSTTPHQQPGMLAMTLEDAVQWVTDRRGRSVDVRMFSFDLCELEEILHGTTRGGGG
jgi:predicted protein tyrosine phosphatase